MTRKRWRKLMMAQLHREHPADLAEAPKDLRRAKIIHVRYRGSFWANTWNSSYRSYAEHI